MGSGGSVRYGIVIGSAAAVLVLVAAAGLALRGGSGPGTGTDARPPAIAHPQATPDRGGQPQADRVPQPQAPRPPSFDVLKVGPSGTAVIAGRAEPGDTVTVRDAGRIIGEVTADRRGEWVLIPDRPLDPGDRLLSVEASSRESGTTAKSEETVALSIRPAASEGKGETALAVVLPADGRAAKVLQRPDGTSPASALSMESVEYDAKGRAVLSGAAAPGATVQIYLGNERLATVTADAAGKWSATSPRAMPAGRVELRLDQLAPDGRVAQRMAVPFGRAGEVELAPGQDYTVQRGNSLWQIARRAYGSGMRYVIIYAANPDQIRDPQRIYPGQIFKLPKS